MTRISRLALATLLSVNTVFAADGANPLTGLPLPDTATVKFVGFINILQPTRQVYAWALNTPFPNSQDCNRRRRHSLVCGRDNTPGKAAECHDHAVLRHRRDDDRRPIGELE